MNKKAKYGIWVGVIGLLLFGLLTNLGYRYLDKNFQIKQYEVSANTDEVLSQNLKRQTAASYKSDQIKSVDEKTYAVKKQFAAAAVEKNAVGRIVVPAQGIDLPILVGVNDTNLLTGATLLDSSMVMGSNNYVLMAHNIVNMETPFSAIDRLKPDDDIYLSDGVDLFQYQVFLNKRIDMNEVQYIENQASELNGPIVTLFRCDGTVGTPWRRLVQGKLVHKEALKDTDDQKRKLMGISYSNSPKQAASLLKIQDLSKFEKLCLGIVTIFTDYSTVIIPVLFFLVFLLAIGLWKDRQSKGRF